MESMNNLNNLCFKNRFQTKKNDFEKKNDSNNFKSSSNFKNRFAKRDNNLLIKPFLHPLPPGFIEQSHVPLPQGFIEELIQQLRATPGGEDISSMMLLSLNRLENSSITLLPPLNRPQNVQKKESSRLPLHLNLNPLQKVDWVQNTDGDNNNDYDNIDNGTGNNGDNDKGQKKAKHKPLTSLEVSSLQDFVFSNLTKVSSIPYEAQDCLLYGGKLTGITELTLYLQQYEYDQFVEDIDLGKGSSESRNTINTNLTKRIPENPPNVFLFSQYLPKMIHLQSLSFQIIASTSKVKDSSSLWNPFGLIDGYVGLDSLESLKISAAFGLDSLFTRFSFPNLRSITLPSESFSPTNCQEIKSLFGYLSTMPKLKSFLGMCSLYQASPEFIEELLQTPFLLSQIDKLTFPPWIDPSTRNRIFRSPYLTSLNEFCLHGLFRTQDDLNKTLNWLFKMSWMKNIISLTLDDTCHLSPSNAYKIATSSTLINLRTLVINYNKDDKVLDEAVGVLLRSSKVLRQLRVLKIAFPTQKHVEIITKSPYLANLEQIYCCDAPEMSRQSLGISKTLVNLKVIELDCERYKL